MNKNVIVVGGQWGDEGKGKIIDYLAHTGEYQYTARFQGGHNAGHTLWVDGKKTVLRLIPSGILNPHMNCFIGMGVVVHLPSLIQEIKELENNNVPKVRDRLKISLQANIILPTHIALDQARESNSGSDKIGTTGRGIGPAYEDKVARRGIKLYDLYQPNFKEKLTKVVEYHNSILVNYFNQASGFDPTIIYDQYVELANIIQHSNMTVNYAGPVEFNRTIYEGAQALLLDNDLGTYPYVTSSNTVASQVVAGIGHAPKDTEVITVIKAYTTRVGAGPFPTEIFGPTADTISRVGNEFGSVTGRQRRIGWLDLAATNRAIKLNSFGASKSSLAVMKMDVLDSLDEIKVCHTYTNRGNWASDWPFSHEIGTPEFITYKGWKQSTVGITSFDDLPYKAKNFFRDIQHMTGTEIRFISTGTDRRHIIVDPRFGDYQA